MDEGEFRRLLDLFPVVRSPNYCADSESSVGSTSRLPQDEVADWKNAWNEMEKKDALDETTSEDPFWKKLRLAAERKVGPTKAEQFCQAFQSAHEKLVNKDLSLDAAQRFIKAEGN